MVEDYLELINKKYKKKHNVREIINDNYKSKLYKRQERNKYKSKK